MRRDIKVRPGKAQSLMGFIVGIVFVIFGCSLISTGGLFAVLWTVMAVVITIINGVNAFSSKGIATSHIEIQQEDMDSNSSSSVERRLKDVESLYEKGLISKEEFEAKRKEILKSL